MDNDKSISVVVPIYNEAENIEPLYCKLSKVLSTITCEHEIIFVDDGSVDGSVPVLEKIVNDNKKNVKVIIFKRNFGQTAAIAAGIQSSKYDRVLTMDGDLQNDPDDIPALIVKIGEGYDLVSGWRRIRKDPFFSKRLPSLVANRIISAMTGVHLHDHGCTLRVYRKNFIKNVNLYGEMHRFLPALVAIEGGRVAELAVKHHPRTKGKSKYGMARILKVLLDLFVIKFMSGYSTRPIHFFGYFGLASVGLGTVIGIFSLYERYVVGLPGINLLPLILLTMLLILLGAQTILMGLLAEMDKRTYYESQQKKTYVVDRILN